MNEGLLLVIALSATALNAILIYAFLRLYNVFNWTREELQSATDAGHAKCMGAVMKFVGDEWAAQVLDVAAADYESAMNHDQLDRIKRVQWTPGGPPVPSIWMRQRASRLRIDMEAENASIALAAEVQAAHPDIDLSEVTA